MENKFVTESIACKSCGKLHQVKCYPIINFQNADKEFIEKVFTLDLFKVKCDCGAETIVQYDTVIVDMFKKYIVYLYVNNTDEQFYNEVVPALDKMFKENEEYKKTYETLKHTRFVRTINEMLEKLLIFDYDLDDIIIECIKLSLLNNEKFNAENKITAIYFDKLEATTLIFTVIEGNEQPKSIGVDISYYNNILENTSKLDKSPLEKPFAKIDTHIIYDFLNEHATSGNADDAKNEVPEK